ncbi:plastocyanin/azurin family copper-binding protein [Halobacteria archaeon AArc-curdl1]|uniref:Plastocyanin/azurin family copper-binding protein n=1 Tax=Natronosalvus hydrolyticus TaxID=2979988 RepID=A0AAP3E7U4_9EURY|nr:plastocyanin/azurin family copper-binding protein [Halobacteria archaeon AArc-curdl1]
MPRDLATADSVHLDRRKALHGLAFLLASTLWPGSVTAQDDTAEDETQDEPDEEPDEDEEDDTVQPADSVIVELVDFAYEPSTASDLEIPPGTRVEFVWITDNHNIVVDDQPEDADWDGYEPIEDTGFEYEYTFEVEGTYDFHCAPHIGLGMIGTIVVDPEASPDDDAVIPEVVPFSAWTLAIATVVSLVAVLALTYMFMRFGGATGE